jgi:hypothetical protein
MAKTLAIPVFSCCQDCFAQRRGLAMFAPSFAEERFVYPFRDLQTIEFKAFLMTGQSFAKMTEGASDGAGTRLAGASSTDLSTGSVDKGFSRSRAATWGAILSSN